MSCCNLRGLGWGKKNRAVDYVWIDSHGEDALAVYHIAILKEMEYRGYNFDPRWMDLGYCGKRRNPRVVNEDVCRSLLRKQVALEGHTPEFFVLDLETLIKRGVEVVGECVNDTWYVQSGDRSIRYPMEVK